MVIFFLSLLRNVVFSSDGSYPHSIHTDTLFQSSYQNKGKVQDPVGAQVVFA